MQQSLGSLGYPSALSHDLDIIRKNRWFDTLLLPATNSQNHLLYVSHSRHQPTATALPNEPPIPQ